MYMNIINKLTVQFSYVSHKRFEGLIAVLTFSELRFVSEQTKRPAILR